MNRQVEFSDNVFDFGTIVSPRSFNLNVNYSYLGPVSPFQFSYLIETDGGVTSNTYYNTLSGTLSTVQVFNQGSATNSIQRKINSFGLNKDTILLYDSNLTLQDSRTSEFLYFQQAVPILRDITSGSNTSIINNYNKTLGIGSIFSMYLGETRGSEISKALEIFVHDVSGDYIPATVGVDYDVVTGVLSPNASDTVEIRILRNITYKILFKVKGYDSNNNPFVISLGNEERGKVASNESSLIFYLNQELSIFQNTITFPLITNQFSGTNILSSSPETTYQNSPISIEGIVETSTGVWKVKNTNTNIVNDRVLTLSDWKQEILDRCLLFLEIRKKSDQSLSYQSVTGFGPHQVVLSPEEYLVNFKLIKK